MPYHRIKLKTKKENISRTYFINDELCH